MIVDDTRLYRESLAAILEHESWVGDVVVAESAAAAASSIEGPGPYLALVNMAARSSEAIVGELAGVHGLDVIALGVTEEGDEILACAEAGVAGYVLRSQSLDDLLSVMRAVAQGETMCSPRIAATLLRRVATLAAERRAPAPAGPLTPREYEILGLIDDGLSNKEIASRLSIELRTVKNHVHHIFEKLHVARRGEAAARMRVLRAPVPS